jgi:TRAP-type C4-dicarboxylate transport system permease small subunit
MTDILKYEVNTGFQAFIQKVDKALWSIAGGFQHLTNLCLLAMLVLTTGTIVMRPFDLSAVWIWPWTMVLFIWLCFFGFCAFFVRLKDVRIDFIANKCGPGAVAATRILSDVCTLGVTGVLLLQMPTFLESSTGIVDGAILPGGEEVARRALSIPLLFSVVIILFTAVLDLLKMMVGLPENVPPSIVEE